jgi:hypothetical protein
VLPSQGRLSSTHSVQAPRAGTAHTAEQPIIDLLGGLNDLSVGPATVPEDDPFGLAALSSSPADAAPPQLPLLTSAHGCQVHGDIVHDGMQYIFRLSLKNCSRRVMSGFHVQFNRNAAAVGVTLGSTALAIGPLNPGQVGHTSKALDVLPDKMDPSQGSIVQTALKWTELVAASFVMLKVRPLLHRLYHTAGFNVEQATCCAFTLDAGT